jgi:hypothetical protein
MHDKNGKPIAKGDKVIVEAVVLETYRAATFCNVQLGIGRDADHSEFNVHGTLTINAKQVELVEDE